MLSHFMIFKHMTFQFIYKPLNPVSLRNMHNKHAYTHSFKFFLQIFFRAFGLKINDP